MQTGKAAKIIVAGFDHDQERWGAAPERHGLATALTGPAARLVYKRTESVQRTCAWQMPLTRHCSQAKGGMRASGICRCDAAFT